jgi:hypothetical protein
VHGKWSLLAFGLVAVVLLAIGLIATPFAPIFAAVVAFLVMLALLFGSSGRRSREVGSEHAVAAEDRREAGQAARPSASAAPQSGEGGT